MEIDPDYGISMQISVYFQLNRGQRLRYQYANYLREERIEILRRKYGASKRAIMRRKYGR